MSSAVAFRQNGFGASLTRKLLLLSTVFVVASLLTGCGDQWNRHLDPDDEGPHGLSMLPTLLRIGWPAARYELIEREGLGVLPVQPSGDELYVAIGEGLPYDSTEVSQLMAFVRGGGTAFLAAEELSLRLPTALLGKECLAGQTSLYYGDFVKPGDTLIDSRGRTLALDPVTERVGLGEQITILRLPFYCGGRSNVLVRSLSWVDTDAYEDEDFPYDDDAYDDETYGETVDSSFSDGEGLPNYEPQVAAERGAAILVEVPAGRGHVIFYSAPIMLTNAYVADSSGRPHLEQVLSYLPRGARVVYFDGERRASALAVARDNQPDGADFGDRRRDRQNLFREVFKRPPLAAAWYLLLGTVLTFVLFGIKRYQRVVPVVHARSNTTLAYLGSVSRLYLAHPNNALMARKQLNLFEAFCVRKFGLQPLREAEHAARLTELKGVDAKQVENLLRYQNTVSQNQVITNDAFVRLMHILRTLYHQLGRRPTGN